MPDKDSHIALKEWAVTIEALASGQQILLMRKGGIHEESKDFRIIHSEFLLYPTYEHQKPELLKPEHQNSLDEMLKADIDVDKITFSKWARVEEVIEISDQENLDLLNPFHIWTDEYAQGRLHWKPMVPISIMLLRVYTIESVTTIPVIPEYLGCTSWVDIIPKVDISKVTPVLADKAFREQVDSIKGTLGLTVSV
jgi:hypothetical protein|tara:strand:- start:294 stop:881 length:588 start_codon:yes stop_codon:yes gene_type:complete